MDWLSIVIKGVLIFNGFVLVYFLVLNTTYLFLFLLSLREVLRFVRKTFFSDYRQIMQSEMTWPISILVPAHNEEKTIVDTVNSLLMVNYSEFEIIVVNDGSLDGTLQHLIEAFDLKQVSRVYKRSIETKHVKAVYGSLERPNLTVIDKFKGGKADALNAGINCSRYPLFCSIDADSIIEDSALLRVIKPFMERPDITIAAGGIVRIVNACSVRGGRVTEIRVPDRPLPILQVVEYLRAFLMGRVGWSQLHALLIISGAFGVFRKKEIIEIGGYATDSVTEDLELVVRLHRHMTQNRRKYRMVFVPDPVIWTEVPSSWGDLIAQRNRWHRGLADTLWKNRGVCFNPRYGALGMFAFPYFVCFELLGAFVETLGYISVFSSYFLGILNVEFFLLFLLASVLYGTFLSIAAILLEEISFRRYPSWLDLTKLLLFGFLENFGYRQFLALVKIKAFIDFIFRRKSWGKLDRKGFRKDETATAGVSGEEA